jgi:CrcB protein
MNALLLVFAGGGLGSVVRFLLGKWLPITGGMPVGTLLANVAACFILGLVVGVADQRLLMSANARLFWAAGFCGGFSTFSTFTHETISLMQGGHAGNAVLYVIVSLVCCGVAVAGGLYFGGS